MKRLQNYFELNRTQAIIGLLLAAGSCLACLLFHARKAALVLPLLFLAAGCLRLRTPSGLLNWAVNLLWAVSAIAAVTILCPKMAGADPLLQLPGRIMVLNLLCALAFCGILFVLTGSLRWSGSLTACTVFVLSLVNAFVFQFRGRELSLMDFLSVGTALNVAKEYAFSISKDMVNCAFLLIFAIFSQFCLPKLPKQRPLLRRGIALALVAAALLGLHFGAADLFPRSWKLHGSNRNGFCLNLYLELRDSSVTKPQGYSPQMIADCGNAYADAPREAGPNIVVIMDESFADFGVYPHPPRQNKPETPFLDSLQDNLIRGHALASVFGGNTANSEFEFLTGHSMGFLPANVIPYQQYIHNDFYSLAWYLRACGYQTMGTHPYYANGWSRDRRYPQLGFEQSLFLDAYPGTDRIRDYISDREMFGFLLQQLENTDDPLFLFGITMQNHGGYRYQGPDCPAEIRLEEGNFPQAQQYLSLLYETDRAMEDLLQQLTAFPEDTVVLFFGDHQPSVEPEFLEMLNGGPFDTLDQRMTRYQIPFYIWANYDLPAETVELTSLNFLASHLLEAAGLALPPYYQFLQEVEQAVPAMNGLGYYSVEQGHFLPYDQARGQEAEILNRYAAVQYNNLFDRRHLDPRFFSDYIQP